MNRLPRLRLLSSLLIIALISLGCNLSLPISLIQHYRQEDPAAPITSNQMENAAPHATPTPQGTPEFVEVRRTEEDEKLNYTITLLYPEIQNGGEGGDFFNQYMEEMLLGLVGQFRASTESLTDFTQPTTYELTYQLLNTNQRMISILFTETTTYGSTSTSTAFHYSVNYDLSAAQLIELVNLFTPGSPFLPLFASYAQQTFQESEVEITNIGGITPNPDNYRLWNVTPSGLLLSFEPMQLNPSSTTFHQIMIPYDLLVDMLPPNSPLRQYLPLPVLNALRTEMTPII
ncbi:MAG: hypothetical protein JW750_10405 [Anaerolineaceae bacterium]|nr:hypothetical protein [Anaerolineaceae bacterium]